jgi:hypothetical protein
LPLSSPDLLPLASTFPPHFFHLVLLVHSYDVNKRLQIANEYEELQRILPPVSQCCDVTRNTCILIKVITRSGCESGVNTVL